MKNTILATAFLWIGMHMSIHATIYFLANNGNDNDNGTSEHTPWQNLEKLSVLKPGDVVCFNRGDSWIGKIPAITLGISNLTFKAYGSGPMPVLKYPGSISSTGIDLLLVLGNEGNVEEIRFDGTGDSVFALGISGNNCRVSNCIFFDNCYSILLLNGNIEVSYNQFINNAETAIEIASKPGVTLSGIEIHHNYIENCKIFLDIAGALPNNTSGTISNSSVYYNVLINPTLFYVLQLDYTAYVNLKFDNNTLVYSTSPVIGMLYTLDGTSLSQDNVFFRNNLITTPLFNNYSYDHLLGCGVEQCNNITTTDPGFINSPEGDYNLTDSSSARDAGLDLGYTLDFNDNSVPYGSFPDIGAYEYIPGATVTPDVVEAINNRYISIFPNPVTDFINISLPESDLPAIICLYTIDGRLILNEQPEGTRTKINMQFYKSDIYTLKILSSKRTVVKKVLKR